MNVVGSYRWVVATLGVAAVALLATLVLVGGDDGDTRATSTTTTVAPTSTTRSTSTTTAPVRETTAIWPSTGAGPSDPATAARRFAVEFLGFTNPVVGGYQAGDTRSGEVEVRPTESGAVTTVLVRKLTGDTTWSVLGAATADIEVSAPAAGEAITTPVRVSGRALAFEGNVNVEVRADGQAAPIGSGYVTGGGDELRPFVGTIAFTTPPAARGALVFLTRSAKDGSVWQAAAVRVAFGATSGTTVVPASCATDEPPRPAAGEGEMVTVVFFTCTADPTSDFVAHRAYRIVPRSSGVLRAALDALVAGPTPAERDAGLTSWFSAATAHVVRSVNLRDGAAVIDFVDLRPLIPNASASAGSQMLLGELDATVFAIPGIDSVEYRMSGSCDEFATWLQLDCGVHRR